MENTIDCNIKMLKKELSTITKPNNNIFTGNVSITNGIHKKLS